MVRADQTPPYRVVNPDPSARQVFYNFSKKDTAIVVGGTLVTGFYGFATGTIIMYK